MASLDDLLSQIPMDRLAQQLGIDQQTAEQATRQVLPALVGGMQANAKDPAGEASLAGALSDHDDNLLDGGVDLNQVDTNDGEQIVDNIFGPNKDQVVNQLGGLGGAGGAQDGSNLVKQLLPLLAPLVMTFLAKQLGKQGGGAAATTAGGQAGGGLADVLGGLLGGSQGGQGGLADMLGGLLGGGRR